MLLSQLEYFVALAREKHFGRAAAVSHITQSALSEAIRKLEHELGTTLIHRGRSFESLTPEGERVLVWARKMLDDQRALLDEVAPGPEGLTGDVRIGVIPSALPDAAALIAALTTAHPHLRVRSETSLSSEEIIQRIHRSELDAGLIHPSAGGGDTVTITPLSEDPLVVAAPSRLLPGTASEVTPGDLDGLPLALLHAGMRARQLLDQHLAEHGIQLYPQVETDSIEQLTALVHTGRWVVVVPAGAVIAEPTSAVRVATLIEPRVILSIVLATRAEQPRPALSRALLRAAHPLRTADAPRHTPPAT